MLQDDSEARIKIPSRWSRVNGDYVKIASFIIYSSPSDLLCSNSVPFYGGVRLRDAITPSSKLSVFIGHFDMTEPADTYLIRVIDL